MPISAYGGKLVDRLIDDKELSARLDKVRDKKYISPDDIINMQNLAAGCYSPLEGFMTEIEYNSVTLSSTLPSGHAWTIPVLLRVEAPPEGDKVALCGPDGVVIGMMEVESVFVIDNEKFCRNVFGTADRDHPGVRHAMKKEGTCIGGKIFLSRSGMATHRHFRTPRECRGWLKATGKKAFTAFSTRNVCHIGHQHLHGLALDVTDMLGINVITGAQVEGSFLPDVVFDIYEHLISGSYPKGRVFLNNLMIPPIYAGPKEAFLQATMLQNYGFTHVIIGRDHAGVGRYYPKYGSQKIFEELKGLDISVLPIAEPVFCKVCNKVTTEVFCRHTGDDIRHLNGRDVRRYLMEKRHEELDAVIGKDVRDLLVGMLEKNAKIFY
ncbi:MAG: hypothetical protein WC515_07215 [Candidatus Omnitrophota bacterium]